MTASEAERQPGRFKPVHYVYGAALTASALTTFTRSDVATGVAVLGLSSAALILGAWAYVFQSHSRPRAVRRVIECALILLVVLFVFGLFVFFPRIQSARGASQRSQSMSRLRQVAIAVLNYEAANGSLPPAFTVDEDGNRLHSWRTLMLGLLGWAPLHRMCDYEQPWNSPHNRKLSEVSLPILMDPRSKGQGDGPDRHTSYVAVIGERTAWPGARGRRIEEITDGLSNTILLIEIHTTHIHWAEPRDLTLDEALDIMTSNDPDVVGVYARQDFFYEYEYTVGSRHVVFANGHVRTVPFGIDREACRQLLTIDDGVPGESWDSASWARGGRATLKVGNCCRFAVFVLLALLPFPWVWRNPRNSSAEV